MIWFRQTMHWRGSTLHDLFGPSSSTVCCRYSHLYGGFCSPPSYSSFPSELFHFWPPSFVEFAASLCNIFRWNNHGSSCTQLICFLSKPRLNGCSHAAPVLPSPISKWWTPPLMATHEATFPAVVPCTGIASMSSTRICPHLIWPICDSRKTRWLKSWYLGYNTTLFCISLAHLGFGLPHGGSVLCLLCLLFSLIMDHIWWLLFPPTIILVETYPKWIVLVVTSLPINNHFDGDSIPAYESY